MKIKFPQLPFLTREMLKFGNKTPMRLRISACSNKVGEVRMRGFTRNGMIILNTQTTADGKVSTDNIGIDDFPVFISVVDPADAFLPGQAWGNVSLEIGENDTIPLCSGFIYGDKGVMWPDANHVDSVPGRGFLTTVSSADPAANTEVTVTVPDGELWLVHRLNVALVTDANAANRRVHFVFTDPGGGVCEAISTSDHPASTNRAYHVATYGTKGGTQVGGNEMIGLPSNLWIGPAGTITTETLSKQAGDNYGVMKVFVEKFFGFAAN